MHAHVHIWTWIKRGWTWLVHVCDTTHSYARDMPNSYVCDMKDSYGVASVSRIDKIIGLFCKRALYKRLYSAKVTYNFIDPTDRSHPICHTRSLEKRLPTLIMLQIMCTPLMEEIRIQIFRSPDYTGFLYNQRSDGDSCLLTWKLVWNCGESRENLFGFPVKTCLEFWQS